MTEATYAHAECAPGSHTVETGDETVTFTCTETGEVWTAARCIAINTSGRNTGKRCNAGVQRDSEGPTCHTHSRTRTVCAACGTKVSITDGVPSHRATHAFETADGIHCWTCGLRGKKRMGTIGHVWDHDPIPETVGYATVRD